MEPDAGARVSVSVIVPVYNPGKFLAPCVTSLVGQSLPSTEFELIFVDDGSTDDTPAALDELAGTYANVQVFHEPGSGWPGRPRNVGIDHATGDYVFFCDHDDWLAPRALQRMVSYADRTGADVLIPKMIGHHRAVPEELFLIDRPDATLATAPLMDSLTPHKLFRRSFLAAHALRFAEGRRRLEDHVFVIPAYFLATTIAVLSSYPCYHHIRRDDEGNAALDDADPEVYFRYLREVLDTIDAHTEPGELRDRLLERPFRNEMLRKLERRRSFGDEPPERQQRQFDAVRGVMLERFDPDFESRLGLLERARADVVRRDRIDLMVDLNQRSAALRGRASLRSAHWRLDHWRLELEVACQLAADSPTRFTPTGEGTWSVDPRLLPAELVDHHDVSTAELLNTEVFMTVIDRESNVDWFVPIEVRPELRALSGTPDHELILAVTASLDVATLAGGRPLPDGVWDVWIRTQPLAAVLRTRLAAAATTERPLPPAAITGPRPAVARLYLSGAGERLTIDVGQQRKSLLNAMLEYPIGPLVINGDRMRAAVALDIAPSAAKRALRLNLLAGDEIVAHCEGVLRTVDGQAVLAATAIPVRTEGDGPLDPGSYRVKARSRPGDRRRTIGAVDVDDHGRIVSGELHAPSPASIAEPGPDELP